jgi:hypothetical protein
MLSLLLSKCTVLSRYGIRSVKTCCLMGLSLDMSRILRHLCLFIAENLIYFLGETEVVICYFSQTRGYFLYIHRAALVFLAIHTHEKYSTHSTNNNFQLIPQTTNPQTCLSQTSWPIAHSSAMTIRQPSVTDFEADSILQTILPPSKRSHLTRSISPSPTTQTWNLMSSSLLRFVVPSDSDLVVVALKRHMRACSMNLLFLYGRKKKAGVVELSKWTVVLFSVSVGWE